MRNNTKKAMCDTVQSVHIANKITLDTNQTQPNHITKTDDLSTELRTKILSIIGAGEENAISLSELMTLTGLGDRELRKHIERLRRDGAVIISGKKGYFQPLRSYEVERYVKQETGRAKSIFRTLRAARNWIERGKI